MAKGLRSNQQTMRTGAGITMGKTFVKGTQCCFQGDKTLPLWRRHLRFDSFTIKGDAVKRTAGRREETPGRAKLGAGSTEVGRDFLAFKQIKEQIGQSEMILPLTAAVLGATGTKGFAPADSGAVVELILKQGDSRKAGGHPRNFINGKLCNFPLQAADDLAPAPLKGGGIMIHSP